MNNAIEAKFQKMGARVKVASFPALRPGRDWNGGPRRDRRDWARDLGPFRIDIARDRDGEFFDLRHRSDVEVQVLDVRPSDRHLLLLTRESGRKSKFLCGHDERSWFVAAIPEKARARDVQDAKDALKPPAVWNAMRELGVPPARRDHRRTAAFVRQGEWFFIPRPAFRMDVRFALRNEPIRRGAGKPHMCQFLYRVGGEEVFVNSRYPNGLTQAGYLKLPREERRGGWRRMVRDAHVYVKGKVRHSDHATITLALWHEVVMNTETEATAMRHVAFLD